MFRASLQHPAVAREFLEMHLPEPIKKELDFNSIIYCQNSFIDEQLKLSESDVLLKASISGKKAYLYILAEHQSSSDELMPFRLLKYMLNIWEMHLKESGARNALPFPVIFPLVFFTGRRPYTAARTLWELCGSQAEMMQTIFQSAFHLGSVDISFQASKKFINVILLRFLTQKSSMCFSTPAVFSLRAATI